MWFGLQFASIIALQCFDWFEVGYFLIFSPWADFVGWGKTAAWDHESVIPPVFFAG